MVISGGLVCNVKRLDRFDGVLSKASWLLGLHLTGSDCSAHGRNGLALTYIG